MSNLDKEITALKASIDRLITLLEGETGIMVKSDASAQIERLMAHIEQMRTALVAVSTMLETESDTDFRQMMERPEVELNDRNTQGDALGDDAARV